MTVCACRIWLFNFEELAEIVLGSERADLGAGKILAETVLAAKQAHFSKNNLDKVGSVDTPVPYRMSDVLTHPRPGDGRAQPAGERRRLPDRQGPHQPCCRRLALRLCLRPPPEPARRHVGDPVPPVPHPGRRQADHDPRHLGGALGGAECRRLGGLPADLRLRDVERGARSRSRSSARKRTAMRRATRSSASSRPSAPCRVSPRKAANTAFRYAS